MDNHLKAKDQYTLAHSPETYFEVYKIDYLKDNDPLLYHQRITSPHPYHPIVIKVQDKTLYTSVTLEHTPHRLDDIAGCLKAKTHRSIVNLVAETIIGFQSLYRKVGAFKIKTAFIGYDKRWITRVWLNNNFAKNHLNPFDHMASDSQETMIKSIIGIYEHHGYQDEELRSATSFKEAMRILVGKVTDQVKNELVNALSERGRQKEKEKEKQKQKQKLKDKAADYEIPTTPKHKAKEEGSFNDKGKQHRQQHIQVHQKLSLQTKALKIPKVSQETNVPHSEKKQKLNHHDPASSKDLHQSYRQDYSESNDDFLIIRRQIEVPEVANEAGVKEFFGSSANSYEAKMKLVGIVLQSHEASPKVKQLAQIFQYALTKDPELYKSLLTENGDVSNLTETDREKVSKVKKLKLNLYPKHSKPPCSEQIEIKKKQSHEIYHPAKLSEEVDDPARKNMHFGPIQPGYPPIHSHRPNTKPYTMKETGMRPFNINPDRIEIPSRNPVDEFACSHSEIPVRSDYKLSNGTSIKPQTQPRSHQKSSHQLPYRQQKPFAAQIMLTKNPNKQATNFRDQVFKYVGKQ